MATEPRTDDMNTPTNKTETAARLKQRRNELGGDEDEIKTVRKSARRRDGNGVATETEARLIR